MVTAFRGRNHCIDQGDASSVHVEAVRMIVGLTKMGCMLAQWHVACIIGNAIHILMTLDL